MHSINRLEANKTMLWHMKMVHMHHQAFYIINAKNLVIGLLTLTKTSFTVHVDCMANKQSCKLIPHKSQSRVREVLELLHMDICGTFSLYHFLGQNI
jgi:hypothetical protein